MSTGSIELPFDNDSGISGNIGKPILAATDALILSSNLAEYLYHCACGN
jgi:hypothetical protein